MKMKNSFKITLCIIGVIFVYSYISLAQSNSNKFTISGKVIDAESSKALNDVNVYIAYSQMGTATNNDGMFIISNIPFGTFNLIISCIGYNSIVVEINLSNYSGKNMQFQLQPKIYVLPTVNIIDNDADLWRENMNLFTNEFVGTTENADETIIEDPYIVEFDTNENGELTAKAEEPLVLFNNALGYKITYFLNKFVSNGLTTQFNGFPVFEELTARDDAERNKWKINRRKTYLGSLRHFLKSICENYNKPWIRISDIGYRVSSQLELDSKSPSITVITAKYLKKTDNDKEMFLTFKDFWNVYYKYPNPDSDNFSVIRQSWIKLHADSVCIDAYGRYYDSYKIQTFGSWAVYRMADMIPYEYDPEENIILK